jgi:hypothetical protein
MGKEVSALCGCGDLDDLGFGWVFDTIDEQFALFCKWINRASSKFVRNFGSTGTNRNQGERTWRENMEREHGSLSSRFEPVIKTGVSINVFVTLHL